MAFTFNSALASDLDRVRLNIGDTVADDGVLPNRANVANEVITALLSSEENIPCATATACEYIAASWRSRPAFGLTDNGLPADSIATNWDRQAATWRERCAATGGGDTGAVYLSVATFTKSDSFADEAGEYA
jgi:hypothetical protein